MCIQYKGLQYTNIFIIHIYLVYIYVYNEHVYGSLFYVCILHVCIRLSFLEQLVYTYTFTMQTCIQLSFLYMYTSNIYTAFSFRVPIGINKWTISVYTYMYNKKMYTALIDINKSRIHFCIVHVCIHTNCSFIDTNWNPETTALICILQRFILLFIFRVAISINKGTMQTHVQLLKRSFVQEDFVSLLFATMSRLLNNRSLLQKSPTKETIFCISYTFVFVLYTHCSYLLIYRSYLSLLFALCRSYLLIYLLYE